MSHLLTKEEFEAGLKQWNGSAKLEGMELTEAEIEKLKKMRDEGRSIEEMIEAIKMEGGSPPN